MHSVAPSLLAAAPRLLEDFAWPMFWQSTLLIVLLYLVEAGLRRRLRPAARYSLWLLVLLKMVLPPSLALPTGVGWWMRPLISKQAAVRPTVVVVHFDDSKAASAPLEPEYVAVAPARTVFSAQAWLVLFWLFAGLGLFAWMLRRWRDVAVTARRAEPASKRMDQLLQEAREAAGVGAQVRLGITDKTNSPVVFGFVRPVILLPASLSSNLSESQLRGVLLHELIHLRRRDVWINCAQTLLQIVYWWHPLLWLANGRIRRIREEAVDDAVMCALREEANDYPQTLIEVAKLALGRPLSGLALVGILESRMALRRRIERLVNFQFPRKAGLSIWSVLSLMAFGALALPMGPAPVRMAQAPSTPGPAAESWPDPRFPGYAVVSLNARFLTVDTSLLELFLPGVAGGQTPLVLTSNDLAGVEKKLKQADAQFFSKPTALRHSYFSGGRFHYQVGGVNGNGVNYQTQTNGDGSLVVVGAECSYYVGPRPDWAPLDFTLVPWLYRGTTLCQVRLGLADEVGSALEAEVTIPAGGALLFAAPGLRSGKSELAFLKEGKTAADDSPDASEAAKQSQTEQDKQVASLVRDAKVYFEAGKLDEADAILKKAFALDPWAPSAHYYRDLVAKTRSEKRPPVRLIHPGGTNRVLASNAPQNLYLELKRIRLKEISFDHQPLAEVLRRLNDEVSPNFTFRFKAVAGGGSSSQRDPGAAAAATKDITQVPITILPSLVDVRLCDVLDVVTKVATQRISYSIEKDGVEFSAYSPNEKPLYTRIIKVDWTTTRKRLAEESRKTDVTGPEGAINALCQLLLSNGVKLQPSETLFLNDREQYLLAHATAEHLDVIEKTLTELNAPQIQINLKTRFVHVPHSAVHELWKAIEAVQVNATNYSKILTPTQTAAALKTINTKGRDYLINEASVTTLSGHQCEVECVDLRTVVSNNVPTKIPFGPSVDLIPVLSPDNWKVNLRTIASLTEFLGYDDQGMFRPQFEDPKGQAQPLGPVPHIRLRLLVSDSSVPDGYTLLLCNPVDQRGALAEKPGDPERHYFVLITATVLSPTGGRLHSEAEIKEFMK